MSLSPINVLITVFSLIILMIPGFILRKSKMLGEGADKVLSNVVLYVGQPFLIFMCFQKAYEAKIAVNFLIALALGFLVHGLMILFVYLVVRNKGKDAKKDVCRFASVFSNIGYMGVPFLQTLYVGRPELSEIIIYCAAILVVFNVLSWTIGVVMYSHDKSTISAKKIATNPTIIGVVAGLIYFFLIKTPIADLAAQGSTLDLLLEKIMNSANFVAELVTPLSMFVIGMKLAETTVKDIFTEKWVYISSAYKLLVMPLICIACVLFLPIDNNIKYALFFAVAMPSAASSALMAVRYKGDGKTASAVVLFSTVLSIVTISLLYMLLNFLLSIV